MSPTQWLPSCFSTSFQKKNFKSFNVCKFWGLLQFSQNQSNLYLVFLRCYPKIGSWHPIDSFLGYIRHKIYFDFFLGSSIWFFFINFPHLFKFMLKFDTMKMFLVLFWCCFDMIIRDDNTSVFKYWHLVSKT